jgi:hypothetical protein
MLAAVGTAATFWSLPIPLHFNSYTRYTIQQNTLIEKGNYHYLTYRNASMILKLLGVFCTYVTN